MTKEITKELKACRKAWKDNPAKLAWCCHHTILIEPLTEPAENRIAHILSAKPLNEQAIRLKNFRPVRVTLPAELDKARAEWNKASAEWNKELTALHAQDWPNNTWNGESIFI